MCRRICNLPELSIRIYLIRLLPIFCSKTLTRLTSNFVCHYSLHKEAVFLADQEILILNSGGAQIRRYITKRSDYKVMIRINNANVPADLQLSCK